MRSWRWPKISFIPHATALLFRNSLKYTPPFLKVSSANQFTATSSKSYRYYLAFIANLKTEKGLRRMHMVYKRCAWVAILICFEPSHCYSRAPSTSGHNETEFQILTTTSARIFTLRASFLSTLRSIATFGLEKESNADSAIDFPPPTHARQNLKLQNGHGGNGEVFSVER